LRFESIAVRTLELAAAPEFAGVRAPAAADLLTMLGAGLNSHRDHPAEAAHA